MSLESVNDMKCKISVVVPIYNTEKYLRECVESVLCQTFTDYELILINDGSKDSSGEICDEYAKRDSRVKVIHKSNTGVSDTRNYALDIAQGEYLILLDADDYWCDNSCLQKLYDIAEKNHLDIVRGEYKAVDSSGKDLFIPVINHEKQENQCRELDAATFVESIVQLEFFMVLCLFRCSVIKEMRFNVKRVFLEDVELFIRILLKSPKCYYLPLYFYAYRKHPETVSNTNSIKKLEDAFSISYFLNNCAQVAFDPRIKQYCLDEGIKRYRRSMSMLTINTHFFNRSYIIKSLNLKCMSKDVRRWIEISSTKFYSPVYYLSPSLGVLYMRYGNVILDTIYRCRQLFKKLKHK